MQNIILKFDHDECNLEARIDQVLFRTDGQVVIAGVCTACNVKVVKVYDATEMLIKYAEAA